MEKVEIGKICYKGPHAYFDGEVDYGCCGSHEYATVYVMVEEDAPNPRGETLSVEEVAAELKRVVTEWDRLTQKEGF